jgi:hypothetical protein
MMNETLLQITSWPAAVAVVGTTFALAWIICTIIDGIARVLRAVLGDF